MAVKIQHRVHYNIILHDEILLLFLNQNFRNTSLTQIRAAQPVLESYCVERVVSGYKLSLDEFMTGQSHECNVAKRSSESTMLTA